MKISIRKDNVEGRIRKGVCLKKKSNKNEQVNEQRSIFSQQTFFSKPSKAVKKLFKTSKTKNKQPAIGRA